jgi:hypothetical protein
MPTAAEAEDFSGTLADAKPLTFDAPFIAAGLVAV